MVLYLKGTKTLSNTSLVINILGFFFRVAHTLQSSPFLSLRNIFYYHLSREKWRENTDCGSSHIVPKEEG